MAQVTLPHTIDAGTPITAVEHQSNYVALRDAINGDLEGGSSGNLKANGVTARELDDPLMLGLHPADVRQEGVVNAGDGKVTPGANLILNYAAVTLAYINDSNGVLATNALLPASASAGSVTIAANASGNPRIDQVILTLTGYRGGSVSVLQGTATAGATLANRNGAATLPVGAIRLADILMPNGFAGPFVQNTHIRDRRQWARGAKMRLVDSGGDISMTISAPVAIGTAQRVEVSGLWPVRLTAEAVLESVTAANSRAVFNWEVDGAAHYGHNAQYTVVAQPVDTEIVIVTTLIPAAGSHTYRQMWAEQANDVILHRGGATNTGLITVIEELVGFQNAANDGA